ncbi:hypothetical protein ABT063_51450 [Streptomyces sp. NPDC002838]|uniref:hypothetical protein n=1 Tax=Streptomyces sp. NPDC002838 TaxID=3154436 RepID=UPI00331C0568
MVFYAAPHWRGLALSGADEEFRAFRAEFIRRLPNESSLRTTAKPWFIHQLRVIADTIETAAALGNGNPKGNSAPESPG